MIYIGSFTCSFSFSLFLIFHDGQCQYVAGVLQTLVGQGICGGNWLVASPWCFACIHILIFSVSACRIVLCPCNIICLFLLRHGYESKGLLIVARPRSSFRPISAMNLSCNISCISLWGLRSLLHGYLARSNDGGLCSSRIYKMKNSLQFLSGWNINVQVCEWSLFESLCLLIVLIEIKYKYLLFFEFLLGFSEKVQKIKNGSVAKSSHVIARGNLWQHREANPIYLI